MKPFQFPMRDPLFAIHALYTLAFSLSRRVGKGAGAWAWTGRRARKIGGFLVGAEVTGFSTSRTDEEIRDLSRTFNASSTRVKWNDLWEEEDGIIDMPCTSRCVGKFYFCFSWSRLNRIELLPLFGKGRKRVRYKGWCFWKIVALILRLCATFPFRNFRFRREESIDRYLIESLELGTFWYY